MEMTGKVLPDLRAGAALVSNWQSPLGVLTLQPGRGCSKARLLDPDSSSPACRAVLPPDHTALGHASSCPLGSPLRGKHQNCCSLKYQPRAGDSENR